MRLPKQPRGRPAIAIAASEAALVAGGRVHTVPAPLLTDQMTTEEWEAVLSALRAQAGERALRVTLALPAQAAPLQVLRTTPQGKGWQIQAALELLPESTPVVVSGGGRDAPTWLCATHRETLARLEAASKASGVRLEAVEPAALALLRLRPRGTASGTVLVAAVSASGCEIAAGQAGAPILARSVATKRPEDVTSEIELTVQYLQREGTADISIVLAGPSAEAVATSLQARGMPPAEIIPSPSAAAAVATGASYRTRGPDFLRELPGRKPGAAHAAAAVSAAALPLVLLYSMHQLSTVASLRERVQAARAEQQALQAQLDRWTGPRAQAARQALQTLESRRLQLGFLDQLADLLPDDLWVERVEARQGTVRIEGQSLSKDSIIRFAQRARSIWPSAILRIAGREETPVSYYRFVLESSAATAAAGGLPAPPPGIPPTAPGAPTTPEGVRP